MQQLDRLVSDVDSQHIVGAHLAQTVAVASDVWPIVEAWPNAHFDLARRSNDKRPIAQGMRADRHDDERVDVWLDNWPTTGERISGGAGRRRNDQAVTAMGINVLAVDELTHKAAAKKRGVDSNQ